ncbi:MAG: hypothetical protein IPK13_09260 [Deltaproteobacteria bacterium]|nr:hypothetical protein [Deltaproteobacteria bacterium]
MDEHGLLDALEALGDLLESRNENADLAVIGGGALLLAGFIERPTRDLDAVALHSEGHLTSAHPLPESLQRAVHDVGRAYGLALNWLNGGPTDLLRMGLPTGFLERATKLQFSALVVRVAGRLDQIHFKLYAAVDQGPRSKHMQDLKRLEPTASELTSAAAWCQTHDPSEGFAAMLKQTLEALGISRDG